MLAVTSILCPGLASAASAAALSRPFSVLGSTRLAPSVAQHSRSHSTSRKQLKKTSHGPHDPQDTASNKDRHPRTTVVKQQPFSSWRDRLAAAHSPPVSTHSTPGEPNHTPSAASATAAPSAPVNTRAKEGKPKRFLDSYLLVEHVSHRLRQSRVDEALNDIRHSPAANGQAPVWNRILMAYANQGKYGKTLDLFNEMKKRGAQPDAHSWSHLFTSLGLSTSPNRASEAQRLFSRLVSDNAQHLTAYSYNAYLKALAVSGSPHLLAQALDQPPENVRLDRATLTIILNALARASNKASSQPSGSGASQKQQEQSASKGKRVGSSIVSVDSIRAVVAHVSNTGLDADLFAALCMATAKCRGADPAIPLHLLARAGPQAFGKETQEHLPPPSIPLPDKVASQALIGPMPTKVANWALMMAHRIDTASPGITPSSGSARVAAAGDPLLTERVYATLSSSRVRAQFDSLSMDVLFAAMSQAQHSRRSPVLVRMYLDAYHPKLAPAHLPRAFQSLQPLATLERNGPDPSHAAFASLLHAARHLVYDLAETTPVSKPEGAPLLLDVLNHYARVTDGEQWVRSDSEIAAVAQLGRALIAPPAKPMASGSWRAPLKQSKLTQVMDHLLWVLGLRPGSRPVRKLHQLPGPVLSQCLAMCMWARANMPKSDRFSKEKWNERVIELEDACRKVEERSMDPEWQGRKAGRNRGSKKAPKPREQGDVVLRLFED